MDHHCPWLGTCIGRQNYKYFKLFIINLTLALCWGLISHLYELFLLLKESDSDNVGEMIL
jgi:palmitoyltransferase ZDHHC9/14/18